MPVRAHLGREVAAVERGIDDAGAVEVPGGDASEVDHDGHLDGAVAAVEEGHEGAAVHGAVGDGAADGGAVDARALQVRLHCGAAQSHTWSNREEACLSLRIVLEGLVSARAQKFA